MNQRGIAPLIIIFVVIIAISAGAYFLNKQSSSQKNSQSDTINNELAPIKNAASPTSKVSPQPSNSSFSGGNKIHIIVTGPHNSEATPIEIRNIPESQLIAFKCKSDTYEGFMSIEESRLAEQNLSIIRNKLEQIHNTDSLGYIEYCMAQNNTSFINYSVNNENYSSLISDDLNILSTVKIVRAESKYTPCVETMAYKAPSTIFVNCDKYYGDYKVNFSDNSSSKVQ